MHGGTGGIWNAIAETLPRERITLNATVTSVDVAAKTVTLADGKAVPYDALITTLPLTQLLAMTTGAGSEALHKHAATGVYSTSHIIGIGLKGDAHTLAH